MLPYGLRNAATMGQPGSDFSWKHIQSIGMSFHAQADRQNLNPTKGEGDSTEDEPWKTKFQSFQLKS